MLTTTFWRATFLLIFLCTTILPTTLHADQAEVANTLLQQSGFTGGFIVELGSRSGELATALRQSEATQIHGLVRNPERLSAIRESVRASKQYGDIAFDNFSGNVLPYTDNLVNLFVAEDIGDVPLDEVLRVLVPKGVAMIKTGDKWEKLIKPRPEDIDEWSHYLHDATGNSVAHDDQVAPPRHLQWVGSPRWSRHHDRMASMSALVSTGGRMFYIMDEGSRVSIQLPPKWKLIARDAFNGSVLWKRNIENWQTHLWPLKSGPTQLSRRLVSSDDTVFTTLGYNAPVTAINAANGKTILEYKGSDATEEIIHTNGILFLVVRKGEAELQNYVPLNGQVGDQAKVRSLFWNEEPRVVMAFDAKSGQKLWARSTRISPLTLAANGSQLYFHAVSYTHLTLPMTPYV